MRTETDNIKPMSVFVIKKYNNKKKVAILNTARGDMKSIFILLFCLI